MISPENIRLENWWKGPTPYPHYKGQQGNSPPGNLLERTELLIRSSSILKRLVLLLISLNSAFQAKAAVEIGLDWLESGVSVNDYIKVVKVLVRSERYFVEIIENTGYFLYFSEIKHMVAIVITRKNSNRFHFYYIKMV